MKTLAVLFFTLFTCHVSAVNASDWTSADSARELTYVAVAFMDMQTTKDIRNHPDIEEQAPITRAAIGPNPSNRDINVWFAALVSGHYLISRSLNPAKRRQWQYVTIGVHGLVVANNLHIGLRVNF